MGRWRPTRVELARKRPHCQIRLDLKAVAHPDRYGTDQHRAARPTGLARGEIETRAGFLPQADRGRDRNTKPGRHGPDSPAALNRRCNPMTKIERQRLRHGGRSKAKANVNHNPARTGIHHIDSGFG
jgi:hypothetical protein